jgi:hypothetical protein
VKLLNRVLTDFPFGRFFHCDICFSFQTNFAQIWAMPCKKFHDICFNFHTNLKSLLILIRSWTKSMDHTAHASRGNILSLFVPIWKQDHALPFETFESKEVKLHLTARELHRPHGVLLISYIFWGECKPIIIAFLFKYSNKWFALNPRFKYYKSPADKYLSAYSQTCVKQPHKAVTKSCCLTQVAV